ncbi:photosynthetic complex assembly protein PuhC [uncultured Tateyamaria sp.]|uniref:photosynthetic complex assembly protein PuhC n=1 Tax=uncultured Tateyamaria sp. TaxID=455651 RepID=UPI00262B2200|nr:photosynthetic complex assembly protein PuhC [uncultured Tateyamaria sp.]
MSDTHTARIHAKEEELVPRVLVRAVMALLLIILSMVTIATLTNRPLESQPSQGPILTERAIFLSGEASGAARVLDANGALLADFPADEGGFVAGIERVIIRERQKTGGAADAPILLRLRAGNRLSIYDPETDWSAELMGFGADNLRTFARLLDQP